MCTVHAEDTAIRKLPFLPKKKRLIKIDLLVIRTSKTGLIGNSSPCVHCLLLLQQKLPQKGYILQDIYYSNAAGCIIRSDLESLLTREDLYYSRFYKKREFKLK